MDDRIIEYVGPAEMNGVINVMVEGQFISPFNSFNWPSLSAVIRYTTCLEPYNSTKGHET